MPDVFGVLLDGPVGGEEAALGGVHDAKARHLVLVLDALVEPALAKQPDAALPYLEQNRLELWVHNKTIQKAVESFRVPTERKAYLKTLRR